MGGKNLYIYAAIEKPLDCISAAVKGFSIAMRI